MPYEHLDNPPASVTVERVGNGAAFQYRVTCTACGKAEQTFSPTEADAIVQEYARHDHRLRNIIRFFRNSERRKIIRRNVTLEEARAHCNRSDSRDPKGRWFDGFDLV